ncbi:hypothetical protein [Mesobacillus campisalis]|uniref:hypothetical protein n=1 Tax=Mesobacillus campisalis TaxID=1408103 RepID=UPI00138F6649|nr:hypothetical protein [Mesobacillus campisalis]
MSASRKSDVRTFSKHVDQIADSAEWGRTPPMTISPIGMFLPLYHLVRVVAPALVPSITIIGQFLLFILRFG